MREAYHRRIPPALVLGVMLTENDGFKRNARSNVGALGLMQIMPRVWTPNLGPILGRDLRDDETNLRYGVYILKHLAKRTADTLDARDVTRIALLRYNGCVTRIQHAELPCDIRSKVRRHVDRSARTICSGRDFHECVALPLWAALRDTTTPSVPRTEPAPVHVDSVSGDVMHDGESPRRRSRTDGHGFGRHRRYAGAPHRADATGRMRRRARPSAAPVSRSSGRGALPLNRLDPRLRVLLHADLGALRENLQPEVHVVGGRGTEKDPLGR